MQKVFVALIFSLLSCSAMADVPADKRPEVSHLIEFVKTSSCIVTRNGDDHQGKDAAKHISKKYQHYRDDIKTSEDFIRLSATKSTMSGKMYKVKCPGKRELTTQDWLLGELKVFRDKE